MKYELGTVTIRVFCEAYEDEDDGDITLRAGSPPTLELEIDLPGNDPTALAGKYLRRVADQVAALSSPVGVVEGDPQQ